jgi:hypothetical protein
LQAAQGGYRANLAENVSALRIKAASGHSTELRGTLYGNPNLAAQLRF